MTMYSIIVVMHKKFYASGFLYHLPSQQILLQQKIQPSSVIASPWFLFSGLYTKIDGQNEAFKNIVFDLLRIKIKTVYTVYSYVKESTGIHHAIVYAELNRLQNFPSKKGLTFAWFSFKHVAKLHIEEQTKHDIVVGQRVIDATRRKSEGEHTFQ